MTSEPTTDDAEAATGQTDAAEHGETGEQDGTREQDDRPSLDQQIAEAEERNPEGKPRLDRTDESQDFVDASAMDFDPDDGVYSGTVVDGSTKIDGPHIGEDGSVDEQEQKEFLEQGRKDAQEQGMLDHLPDAGSADGDAPDATDAADGNDATDTADATDAADGSDSFDDKGATDSSDDSGSEPESGEAHRPRPGPGTDRDAGLDILDSDH